MIKIIKKTTKNLWAKFNSDSLFRNSIYLMLSTVVMASFGFLFWTIATHLFSSSQVGISTSLVAAATLLAAISTLGFNTSIIRFLAASKKPNNQLSSAFLITCVAALLSSVCFSTWAIVSHNAAFNSSEKVLLSIIFVTYVVLITLNGLVDSIFIARRMAKYVLIKNSILSLTKPLSLLLFIGFGFIGIIGSITLATAVAFFIGFVWIIVKLRYKIMFLIDREHLLEIRRFAAGSYGGNVFGMLPPTIVPLIIISKLGAHEAAYFYMPMMIVSLLNIIPSATAQSLFAEVSYNDASLVKNLFRAVRHMFIILIPGAIAVILLSNILLWFFGPAYVIHGAVPLRILALSSIIGAVNYLGDAILNIKKRSDLYMLMSGINAVIIVVLVYLVAPRGLTAVAISILIGQILTLLIYLQINWTLLKATFASHSL